jgi:large subunit ribosomal protein L9
MRTQGVEVDRRRIVLHEPVKSLGTHKISIRLHRKVAAEVTLLVESEQGEASAPSEPREPSEFDEDDE